MSGSSQAMNLIADVIPHTIIKSFLNIMVQAEPDWWKFQKNIKDLLHFTIADAIYMYSPIESWMKKLTLVWSDHVLNKTIGVSAIELLDEFILRSIGQKGVRAPSKQVFNMKKLIEVVGANFGTFAFREWTDFGRRLPQSFGQDGASRITTPPQNINITIANDSGYLH